MKGIGGYRRCLFNPAPPEGLEPPTGWLTPTCDYMLEDAIRLPSKTVRGEQRLSMLRIAQMIAARFAAITMPFGISRKNILAEASYPS
jgi:hypothetical protein